MIDAETRKEFDAAIDWLESQAEYDDGRFINHQAPYSSYMANIKYDTCPREGWADYCMPCSKYKLPKFVTGLPWDEQDEKAWLVDGEPCGNYTRYGAYLTERGYYTKTEHEIF